MTLYTQAAINAEQYTDLLNFYHYANLALQQLTIIAAEDGEANLAMGRLVEDGQYYAAKLERWLPDSCYNNQAYRGRPSEFYL